MSECKDKSENAAVKTFLSNCNQQTLISLLLLSRDLGLSLLAKKCEDRIRDTLTNGLWCVSSDSVAVKDANALCDSLSISRTEEFQNSDFANFQYNRGESLANFWRSGIVDNKTDVIERDDSTSYRLWMCSHDVVMETLSERTMKSSSKMIGDFDIILYSVNDEGESMKFYARRAVISLSGKLCAMLDFQHLSLRIENQDPERCDHFDIEHATPVQIEESRAFKEEGRLSRRYLDVSQTHPLLVSALLDWLYSGSLPSLPLSSSDSTNMEDTVVGQCKFSSEHRDLQELEFSLRLLFLCDEYLLPLRFMEQAETRCINQLKYLTQRNNAASDLNCDTLLQVADTALKASILLNAQRLKCSCAALLVRLISKRQRTLQAAPKGMSLAQSFSTTLSNYMYNDMNSTHNSKARPDNAILIDKGEGEGEHENFETDNDKECTLLEILGILSNRQ